MDDGCRSLYVDELEMAILAVGLELVRSHNLFPDDEATQRSLRGQLYGLMAT